MENYGAAKKTIELLLPDLESLCLEVRAAKRLLADHAGTSVSEHELLSHRKAPQILQANKDAFDGVRQSLESTQSADEAVQRIIAVLRSLTLKGRSGIVVVP